MRAGLRLLEDEEKLREIRHKELKTTIQEGIDSEDAGSIGKSFKGSAHAEERAKGSSK